MSGNFPSQSYFSTPGVSDEVLRSCSVLPEGMSLLGTVLIDMAAVRGPERRFKLGSKTQLNTPKCGASVQNYNVCGAGRQGRSAGSLKRQRVSMGCTL